MSNPAVIKLQQNNIGKSRVWLDDNFGEAIHIHIDDIRVDLSVEEFNVLYKDIADSINSMITVKGFDCKEIDPVYLEVMLWKDLLHLKEIKTDKVLLSQLLAPGKNGISQLPHSRAVLALNGDNRENSGKRLSHHIGQTSEERLQSMLESIRKHGYPLNNNYIIVYGDDNIIRDGQHRAACLYYLNGDIEVPVLRFYFDNYSSENLKFCHSKIYRIIKKIKEHLGNMKSLSGAFKEFRNIAKRFKKIVKDRNMRHYHKNNKDKISEASIIIENK